MFPTMAARKKETDFNEYYKGTFFRIGHVQAGHDGGPALVGAVFIAPDDLIGLHTCF